jgi:hypothetical protein
MVDYFEGTNIPLSYVGDPEERRRFIADIAEAGGDPRKVKSTLWDIGQASGDAHKIHSGEYKLNRSVGDPRRGMGSTWSELSTSDPRGHGTTDVYKNVGGGVTAGPEHGIPDVDIHGYPEGWTREIEGDLQKITTSDGRVYYKPAGGGRSEQVDDGGGGGGDDVGSGAGGGDTTIVVDDPNRETPNLAELTDEMMLSNKVTELINRNSPLFRAAATKAMQRMQARGIVNSSLAYGEVDKAIMAVALPIAQAEVQALQQNLYYNTDWTNKDKFMANEAAYNRMLTQLQGSINMTLQKFISGQQYGLQQLVGQQKMGLQELMGTQATTLQELVGSQETTIKQMQLNADIWSKYGDWITKMATTEGADQEKWQNMLDMLKGAGGWPSFS